MPSPPLHTIMAADWAEALAPVEPAIRDMGAFLREETAQGHGYLPPGEAVFAAFTRPLAEVRVLIVGQDPYPTPGHAMGMSFSVSPHVRPLPRSLTNIFRELETDLGHPPASTGDLSPWADQGVMLLNRCLTVRPGAPGRTGARDGSRSPTVPSRSWWSAALRSWRSCGAGTPARSLPV